MSRAHAAVGLLLLTSALRQDPSAPFRFPETRAGEIAQAWFEAFNSGEDENVIAFERTYRIPAKLKERSAEQRAPQFRQIRTMLGTLTPRSILSEEGGNLTLLVDSTKIDNMRFQTSFELESDPPHKLDSFGLRPAAGQKTLGPYEDWSDLAELLTRVRADAGTPAIAAAWVRAGEVVDAARVGVRRSDGEALLREGDAFHIGSAAKSITATMIARLVEEGVLEWGTTIATALPEIEVRPVYRARTLEELLGHRSGLPGYLTLDDDELARRLGVEEASAVEQRAAFVAEVLATEPETEGTFLYSNAGYAVAARMAEVVTGKPWEALVRELVFAPLEMTSAGIGWPATVEHPDAPYGHHPEGDAYRPQEVGSYVFRPFLAPAGHLHASGVDLARFARAHLRGLRGIDGSLRAETVRRLHTPPAGESYAGGWMVDQLPGGGTRHWHDGTAGTFYASIQLFPEQDLGLVVLLNAPDNRVVDAIANAVMVAAASEGD